MLYKNSKAILNNKTNKFNIHTLSSLYERYSSTASRVFYSKPIAIINHNSWIEMPLLHIITETERASVSVYTMINRSGGAP